MAVFNKLITNLWFDRNAEEAVKFYTSIFENSSIGEYTYFGKEGFDIHGMPEGTVMTIDFKIMGQDFVALNGGPIFKFSEAISFIITCTTQQEIDFFWKKLGEGGDPKAQQCGWLKDRFGLSWQVVPDQLNQMIKDKDKAKVERVTKVMLQMKKLEIAPLEMAFSGRSAAEKQGKDQRNYNG